MYCEENWLYASVYRIVVSSKQLAWLDIILFVLVAQIDSTGDEESLKIVQSYDDLSRKLWQLEGLPLSITSVQAAHPALRYTQVHPTAVEAHRYPIEL